MPLYNPPSQSGEASTVTLEAPTGLVNGSNKAFTFSGPPKIVFRNGVQETRLGAIVGNVFTFTVAPDADDDIEGLV